MNPKKKIIKKWVDALRSGKYKRGVGRLHYRPLNEYCPLGVLCDLYAIKSHKTIEQIADDDFLISKRVAQWIGIADNDPLFQTIMSANDLGSSFEQAASYIEELLNNSA